MARNLALLAAALLTVAAIVLEPTTAAVSDDTAAKPASGKTLDAPAEKGALAFAREASSRAGDADPSAPSDESGRLPEGD